MRTYYWHEGKNDNPFKTMFLRQFILTDADIRIPDETLISLDREVSRFETAIAMDVRRQLISKNELLSSFAISKAEKTNKLNIEEMRQIRASMNETGAPVSPSEEEVLRNPGKAHDKLEYTNILRTYRWSLEAGKITARNLSADLIRQIHMGLTEGLDFFKNKIMGFDIYRPGIFRDNDNIRVKEYRPVEARHIITELDELIRFYRGAPSLKNLGIFHAGLYAIHPFNNGNKRLCRIMEHALMRDLGLNRGNIYSHSYFYYKQMNRFYSSLLKGLLSKNFTPIVNFSRDAIFFSQLDVFRTSVEQHRANFIKAGTAGLTAGAGQARVYSVFIKNKEMNFTKVMKATKKIPDRTVAEYLRQGLKQAILEKRDVGKYSYYSLRLDTDEEKFVKERISNNAGDIGSIPENFLASIYRFDEDWAPAGRHRVEEVKEHAKTEGP